MTPSVSERLAELFRRLEAADPASNEVDGLELLSKLLNAVEDEMTRIPFDPTTRGADGRMYPPQADARRDDKQKRANVHRYRTRKHNVLIGANGAITVETQGGAVIFEKAGRDSRRVRDL